MKKYSVCYYDFRNGAESPIDVIEVDDDYTVEDYIKDCSDNDFTGSFDELVENGEFKFYEVEE